MKDLYKLPDDLPIPLDDGACNHLTGSRLPATILESVSGTPTDLSAIKGLAVIFIYPMNGSPVAPPMVGWDDIPGARGCTPQVRSFRDNYTTLAELGINVFGLSAQALEAQKEASTRLELPFDLLNDSQLTFAKALNLPTFEYESSTYIKRLTLITENGLIKNTFYPVFPPDRNVNEVIEWLKYS